MRGSEFASQRWRSWAIELGFEAAALGVVHFKRNKLGRDGEKKTASLRTSAPSGKPSSARDRSDPPHKVAGLQDRFRSLPPIPAMQNGTSSRLLFCRVRCPA